MKVPEDPGFTKVPIGRPQPICPDAPKLTITKIDAARRQLRTAIRLWFNEGDPVAIHTLLAASHEIIHTLHRHRGLRDDLLYDSLVIKDEFQRHWAKMIKSPATFFKHAQRDPEGVIDFWPYANEVFIIFSLRALDGMKEPFGLEEDAFTHWTLANRPEMLKRNPETNFLQMFSNLFDVCPSASFGNTSLPTGDHSPSIRSTQSRNRACASRLRALATGCGSDRQRS